MTKLKIQNMKAILKFSSLALVPINIKSDINLIRKNAVIYKHLRLHFVNVQHK